MDYGKAVTITRTAKGLSQKELAELIEKTPSYISRIEKGERKPSDEVVKTICRKLGIPAPLFMLIGKRYESMDDKDKGLLDQLGAELLKIIVSR